MSHREGFSAPKYLECCLGSAGALGRLALSGYAWHDGIGNSCATSVQSESNISTWFDRSPRQQTTTAGHEGLVPTAHGSDFGQNASIGFTADGCPL
jgi:hypothetical protein